MTYPENIKVSIIVPTLNKPELVYETLESIKQQTFSDWECIIVDDHSSEKTFEVVNNYCSNDSRFSFFYRPKDRKQGANSCRNYGFIKSSGIYIQWFDADDLMHPQMLALKVKRLENTTADFVVCEGISFKDEMANMIGKWDQLNSTNPLLDHALGKINFQTNAPMFKHEFLEGKNLWDEKLQRKQDYEFFSRLLSYNPSYEIIHKPLFYYRIHKESINGKDNRASLKSMIQADLSVFNNVKVLPLEPEKMIIVQKHFLRKTLGRISKGIITYNPGAILWGSKSLLHIIDLKYLKNYFLTKDYN